ncbi:MAG: signal peptidase I [candidate division WOR-3 bacterium]
MKNGALKLKDEKEASDMFMGIKRIWNNQFFRSLLMLAVLVLGVFAFQRALVLILRTEYPLTTPESWSMYPTIKKGDLLIIQGGFEGKDINVGDVIVFKDPRGGSIPIVHRVVYKEYDETRGEWIFKTKGDNNITSDPWIVRENYIYGKVIFVIPYLGYIKIYLGNEIGIALTIILLVALLLLENWDLLKSKDNEKKEKTNNSLESREE